MALQLLLLCAGRAGARAAVQRSSSSAQMPTKVAVRQQQSEQHERKRPLPSDVGVVEVKPRATMVEIKTWRTKHVDEGWTGRLVGLSWRRGEVEEMWEWTAPEVNANSKKDTGKRMRKEAGKDKADQVNSKKDTGKRMRKEAGKDKVKVSSKKDTGKGTRKHAGTAGGGRGPPRRNVYGSKKDTDKGKGSSKKDTVKSTRKGAGKHKDKDSSKKGAGKGKRKHAGK